MSQVSVRRFWNENPMSYDVDDPSPHPHGSREYFEELDSRVFDPRVLRLTRGADGRPFSRFVAFDAVSGKSVLEVGCGSGFAAQLFAEAGADVTAVDLTPWAIDTTRQRFAAFGLEGRIEEADAESLPFADASFDVVFSWGVIHHTSDMAAALRELVRVCRPDGKFVLMVYNRDSIFFVFYRLLARFLPLARRLGLHFEGSRAGERDGLIARHFSIRELEAVLRRAGLAEIRVQPYGQDAEVLPLPRRIRVPITDALPDKLKDWVLDRVGHQLAVTARKPASDSSRL